MYPGIYPLYSHYLNFSGSCHVSSTATFPSTIQSPLISPWERWQSTSSLNKFKFFHGPCKNDPVQGFSEKKSPSVPSVHWSPFPWKEISENSPGDEGRAASSIIWSSNPQLLFWLGFLVMLKSGDADASTCPSSYVTNVKIHPQLRSSKIWTAQLFSL